MPSNKTPSDREAERQSVLDAIEAYGALSKDELYDKMGAQDRSARSSVGQHTAYLKDSGLIVERNGKFYLADPARHSDSNRQKPEKRSNSTGGKLTFFQHESSDKIALTERERQRPSKTVHVYTSPDEFERIVAVHLQIGGNWVKIPIYSDTRICLGPGIPDWSSEAVANYNVTMLRLITPDGQHVDYETNPGSPVTVDQI